MDCEFKENEKKMRVDMRNSAVEMLETAGIKNVGSYDCQLQDFVFMKWALRVWVKIQKLQC